MRTLSIVGGRRGAAPIADGDVTVLGKAMGKTAPLSVRLPETLNEQWQLTAIDEGIRSADAGDLADWLESASTPEDPPAGNGNDREPPGDQGR